MRCDDAVYPPSVAARLARGTRVLVTEGTADTERPAQHDQAPGQRLGRGRRHRTGLRMLNGVNHFLHLPGVSANTQVLAPSAVAALQAWAPVAAPPAS